MPPALLGAARKLARRLLLPELVAELDAYARLAAGAELELEAQRRRLELLEARVAELYLEVPA